MMIRSLALALSLFAPLAVTADEGALRGQLFPGANEVIHHRELSAHFGFYTSYSSWSSNVGVCDVKTEDFNDLFPIPGLTWSSDTGSAVFSSSGKFYDILDDGETTQFDYSNMEAWGGWFDLSPNGAGNGLTVDIMVDGVPIAQLPNTFQGFWGVIADSAFHSVKLQIGFYSGVQETYTIENMKIVPWCTPVTGGIHGDPHIKKWNGEYFDYHGECDLVLIESKAMDLALHVRSTIRYGYSYVEEAALRIGDEILEVGSFGQHALNGVDSVFAVDTTDTQFTIGGYPIHYTNENKKQSKFVVKLSPTANVTMATFKDLVNIQVSGDSHTLLGDSIGLMGGLDGTLFGRDGVTDMGENYDAFGQEWQVRDDEPMLFRHMRAPQYPSKCVLPTTAEKRRLGENTISMTAAELACSKRFSGEALDLCVNDVLAFDDLEMAEAGAF